MMTVSVALARPPKSARGPLNGLLISLDALSWKATRYTPATRRKSSTTPSYPNEKAQTQNDGERCQRSLLNGAFQSISDGGSGVVRGFGADADPLGGV